MRGKAYLASLVAVVLFPLLWARSWKFAQKHADTDPKAQAKILTAFVASLAILGAGVWMMNGLETTAHDGFYVKLDQRMQAAVGESDYQAAVEDARIAAGSVTKADENVAAARAAGNTTEEEKWQANRDAAADDLAKAQAAIQALSPNHGLYLSVNAALASQDDAAAKALVAGTSVSFDDMQESTDRAFEIKDKAVADLQLSFLWMLYPGLAGAFFAPLAIAMGSVLRAGFEGSDTVGFKPYPGAAAGLFLLFGAFGVPAVPFAAWTFMDMHERSEEGQISL